MGKGGAVYGLPIATDKSADQQEQRGLRLMKIGDQLIDDTEGIAGFDHDLRLGMERLLTCFVQIIEESLQ